MALPNFLIIGAAKSGTTSIASYLGQHPQVYMSPLKEPHFFAFEGEQLDLRGPAYREVHRTAVTDLETYQRLFQNVSNEIAIGEASTTYLVFPGTAERIKRYIPEVKLIVILRHPVEKAFSSFLHLRRDGREKSTDFIQAFNDSESRTLGNWTPLWLYKQMGFYYSQLQRYYNLFDRDQIKVYLYEDLHKNPLGLISDIYHFIGVDNTFVPDISIRENVSGIPRNRMIHSLLHSKNPIRNILGNSYRKLPLSFRNSIRRSNLSKPVLPIEIRNELIDIYREDILKLQVLIQRELSVWL
ncbi:MAG: sulfotransferase [Pseudomonadota bacterium]